MATFYATTTKWDNNSLTTLKIRVNNKALIRTIELSKKQNFELPVWQWLDLLAEIMPKHIHAHLEQFQVYLCKGSLNAPHPSCINHTFIVVQQINNGGEKLYSLENSVNHYWIFKTHPAHLRAILYWWRGNRNQYEVTPCKWTILKVQE